MQVHRQSSVDMIEWFPFVTGDDLPGHFLHGSLSHMLGTEGSLSCSSVAGRSSLTSSTQCVSLPIVFPWRSCLPGDDTSVRHFGD